MKGTYMEAAQILVNMELRHQSFKTVFYNSTAKYKTLSPKQKQIFAIITNLLKNRYQVNQIATTFFSDISTTLSRQMYLQILCFEAFFQKKRRKRMALKMLKHLNGNILDEKLLKGIYNMKEAAEFVDLEGNSTTKYLRINRNIVIYIYIYLH